MGTFKALQNSSFDNFDPSQGSNNFDPAMSGKYNNATGGAGGAASTLVQAKAGQKMQFNITLNNPSAKNLWFEMFCFIDSFIDRLKTEYVNSTYLYVPLLSLEGLTRHSLTHGGVVGFDQNGTLQIQGDLAAAEVSGTIGCGQIAYQGLQKASGITPFTINLIRYTCTTDEQIDNDLIYFTKSYSGGVTANPVTPRSYFKPTQFQNFTIDLPLIVGIDIQSGLKMLVNTGENVRLALFVSIWSDQVTS